MEAHTTTDTLTEELINCLGDSQKDVFLKYHWIKDLDLLEGGYDISFIKMLMEDTFDGIEEPQSRNKPLATELIIDDAKLFRYTGLHSIKYFEDIIYQTNTIWEAAGLASIRYDRTTLTLHFTYTKMPI